MRIHEVLRFYDIIIHTLQRYNEQELRVTHRGFSCPDLSNLIHCLSGLCLGNRVIHEERVAIR